ncbi:uncharacterized protein DS421_20g688820 [Arachis hypogaea]|nr:uncharacterized protein DS421_20g688820 [Arachis hypogaea]
MILMAPPDDCPHQCGFQSHCPRFQRLRSPSPNATFSHLLADLLAILDSLAIPKVMYGDLSAKSEEVKEEIRESSSPLTGNAIGALCHHH